MGTGVRAVCSVQLRILALHASAKKTAIHGFGVPKLRKTDLLALVLNIEGPSAALDAFRFLKVTWHLLEESGVEGLGGQLDLVEGDDEGIAERCADESLGGDFVFAKCFRSLEGGVRIDETSAGKGD